MEAAEICTALRAIPQLIPKAHYPANGLRWSTTSQSWGSMKSSSTETIENDSSKSAETRDKNMDNEVLKFGSVENTIVNDSSSDGLMSLESPVGNSVRYTNFETNCQSDA